MFFSDRLTLDAPRRTKDGYLVTRARASRTGVYAYSGFEIDPHNQHGLRDAASVNVLRDDATVFDQAAVHSFIGKPITLDHPREPVTAANWKEHARGVVMGALRDGDYLAFDLLLMDASAIAAVDAGKKQLSNGYAADIEVGSFVAADGTKCQARQSRITDGNHIALVDRARAGSECRIGDAAPVATSIDEALAAEIERLAKGKGVKASEFMATLPPDKMKEIIESVAQGVVSAASSAGVAKALKLDSFLRDAGGQLLSLVDVDTGVPVRIGESTLAAMIDEANRHGMPLERYTREILRYRPA